AGIEQLGLVEAAGGGGEDQFLADDDGTAAQHDECPEDHQQLGPQRVLRPAPGPATLAASRRWRRPPAASVLAVARLIHHRAGGVLQGRLLVTRVGVIRVKRPLYVPPRFGREPLSCSRPP